MIRSQVYYSQKTGMLTVTPGWPPSPREGDHWVKPASKRPYDGTKHLERKVLEINGCRLKYEDQSGQVRECSRSAFQKWTDDCRSVPKKLSDYKISKGDCSSCQGSGSVERTQGKDKGKYFTCWSCRGEGRVPVLTPKKRRNRSKKKKRTKSS